MLLISYLIGALRFVLYIVLHHWCTSASFSLQLPFFNSVQNARLSFVDCAVIDDLVHMPLVEKCLLKYTFVTKLPL